VAIGYLVEIERQVFAADVVELAEDRPLHRRPKPIDRVGVRVAVQRREHIALGIGFRVVDAAVRDEAVEAPVERAGVRRQHRAARLDRGAEERRHVVARQLGALDGAGLHRAAALEQRRQPALLR
jgi:hypothetical protein